VRKRWRLARTPDRRSRGRPAWKGWPGRRRPWDAVRPVGATVSAPIWTTVSLCDHPTWHDCVGDPRVHPDGQRIAFHVSTPDLHVTYNNVIHLWEPHRGARQLTHGSKDSAPRWSPDGDNLAFLRRRRRQGPTAACQRSCADGRQAVWSTSTDKLHRLLQRFFLMATTPAESTERLLARHAAWYLVAQHVGPLHAPLPDPGRQRLRMRQIPRADPARSVTRPKSWIRRRVDLPRSR